MTNIMQYLIQMSDELKDSYAEIDARLSEILDLLQLLEVRIQELETRINSNRNEE